MTDDTPQTIAVDPSRLAYGAWCHRADKQVGEGDIRAAYSADRIGYGQPVRRPFRHGGKDYVTTGTGGMRDDISASAYRIVTVRHFAGTPRSYRETVLDGDAARRNPLGFYHGMGVTHAGKPHVLVGPEVVFVAGQERQLALF